ncbi:aflatoxin biosynthesis ketoreductase-like protein nor-1, partial [Aureobasidium melanogenum]|uniref:Aflatoxin biosynthesis ketoreductase-like protein nor-1 n=1 Tax=Aureobasidium melanogenum (strain CBS 110374) TaxID=1043003 RepID=A0A074W9F5_AURM1
MPYTVLISGANKGLGLGLLEKYLSRPDTTAIATVRDPSSKEAQALRSIPKASGTNLLIVKVESTSDTDCATAISTIKDQGVSHLDLVIANAGYYSVPPEPQVAKISTKLLMEHVNVNAAGSIRLFQATLPLLQKAKKPVFMYMSTLAGSITATGDVPFPVGVYGASKAAGNFLTRRAHQEHPELIIFAMHPGAVKTPGAMPVIDSLDMDKNFPDMFVEIDKSIDGMVNRIDGATKEDTSGKFWSFDGSILPW